MSSSSGNSNAAPSPPPVIPEGRLRTPHFSQITDPVDTINPITGRSFYFGARPWRCTDRVLDMSMTVSNLDGPAVWRRSWKLLRACASSDAGDEPVDNYYRLPRSEAMYFRDRHVNNMVRTNFFERYPFRGEDLNKVSESDTIRMRTWRYQRLLEKEVETGKAIVTTGDLRSNAGPTAPNEVMGGLQAAMGDGKLKPGEVESHTNLPRDLQPEKGHKGGTQQQQQPPSTMAAVVSASPHLSGQDDMSEREKKYYEMRSFLQRQSMLQKQQEEARREGATSVEGSIMQSMWFGKKSKPEE